MNERKILIGNRKYKDRLFRMLFSDKDKLLELYNALNKSNHMDSDDLQLRGFLYFSELFRPLIDDKKIYSRRMIELPTLVYIVFYNGDKSMGEREVKRLSAAFRHGNEQSKMELEVTILNINYGHNKELMEQCRTLKEYSIFIHKIKRYKEEMELTQAITRAIEECIRENELRDFLKRRKKEVTNSILTQYDEEEVMEMISKESYEDGVEYGMQVGEERGMRIGETRFKILVQKLTEAGRLEDLKRVLSDADFCNEIYMEFGIK